MLARPQHAGQHAGERTGEIRHRVGHHVEAEFGEARRIAIGAGAPAAIANDPQGAAKAA